MYSLWARKIRKKHTPNKLDRIILDWMIIEYEWSLLFHSKRKNLTFPNAFCAMYYE